MLDRVHDTQRTFRRLVRAMSFPGRIVDLGDIAARIEPTPTFSPATLLIALTLLDREVTFHLDTASPEHVRLVAELTFSPLRNSTDADYVFITSSAPEPESVLGGVRTGTLVAPHLGATVVLEVSRLGADPSSADEGGPARSGSPTLQLSGPGNHRSRTLTGSWGFDWPAIRNRLTAEFPAGIDVLLVDAAGRVCAVPRSTRVSVPAGAGV